MDTTMKNINELTVFLRENSEGDTIRNELIVHGFYSSKKGKKIFHAKLRIATDAWNDGKINLLTDELEPNEFHLDFDPKFQTFA
jgi:hypothetical protein